jgi:hypothetical protein
VCPPRSTARLYTVAAAATSWAQPLESKTMVSPSVARRLQPGNDFGGLGVHAASGHRAGGERMVQVANHRALLGEMGDELARREQRRVELLLVLVERARPDHLAGDEVAPRGRAGDDDVAFRDRAVGRKR